MTHSELRIIDRLADAGFGEDLAIRAHAALTRVAAGCGPGSEAIRVTVLSGQVNEAYGDRSNGGELWAIVRDSYLVTVMLRRSDQPATPRALKVDRVSTLS